MAAISAAMLSLPAVAEDGPDSILSGDEVDVSFQTSMARLLAEGYREIKMVNTDPLRLSALDRRGTEVLLTISLIDGQVTRAGFVHAADR